MGIKLGDYIKDPHNVFSKEDVKIIEKYLEDTPKGGENNK